MEMTICVYCASSRACNPDYHSVAADLGRTLGAAGCTVVYGGGSMGSMGALADAAIAAGGRVVGVMPRFMDELECAHRGLSELKLVEDLRVRKHLMLSGSSAVVALPGGSGTLEELLEAMTLKRLGIYLGPIVLVNTRNYFDPLVEMLEAAVQERFMDDRHRQMWQVVRTPGEVLDAIAAAPKWSAEARLFAAR